MSIRAEELKTQILSLSRKDRADIVQTLLESLDDDPGVDPAQYEEILRRVEEVRSGKAEMIPGEEVMRELKVAAAWDAEAERRWQAYLRGDVEAAGAEVALADLRKRLAIPGNQRSSREISTNPSG
ncbi:MAG TPA: addiction module protein [Longimicrobium sp.]|jgi:putative addiction module component (TIGR02574 family)